MGGTQKCHIRFCALRSTFNCDSRELEVLAVKNIMVLPGAMDSDKTTDLECTCQRAVVGSGLAAHSKVPKETPGKPWYTSGSSYRSGNFTEAREAVILDVTVLLEIWLHARLIS